MLLALPTAFPASSSISSLPAHTRRGDFAWDSDRTISTYPASAVAGTLGADLDSLMVACCLEDWDGHGASPVTAESYQAACRFIHSLPMGIPMPELSADPDGCVTFEWRQSARRVLLVSVNGQFRVDYAALFGTAKTYGSEPFFNELPETLTTLVRRVFAA
jgi:hypothetical protein